jgi:hypothetical protein
MDFLVVAIRIGVREQFYKTKKRRQVARRIRALAPTRRARQSPESFGAKICVV